MRFVAISLAALLSGVVPMAQAAPIVFFADGATAAGIQGTVDAYRQALGALNPNVPGIFGSGRREINWDGVPSASSAPNVLPEDFFNTNSPRGVVFSTPGTGFQVSAQGVGAPIEFGHINPSYPELFAPFSAQRLFTALGSNITDVRFFVPGSATPAGVSGFGAVFTDVDLTDSTSLRFFDRDGNSLGTFFAPASVGDETLSFLGVLFDASEMIDRVRITSGNAALSGNESGGIDLVVMDDFIYAEPRAVVQEPSTVLLLVGSLAALGALRRRQYWPHGIAMLREISSRRSTIARRTPGSSATLAA